MTYRDQPFGRFLDDVASENVIPAGGTATALVGATGASLCEMGCIHTVGKEGYDDVAAELAAAREDLEDRRTRLLDLADADADAVERLLAASDEAEGDLTAVKRATTVPLSIAELCLEVLKRGETVSEAASPTVLPDVGVGVCLTQSALRASVFTVRTNLGHVDDASFVEDARERAADAETGAESVFGRVAENLGMER